MEDYGSALSPNESCRRSISSFFSCPKLFTRFSAKGFSESETEMSPTSILDTGPFSCLINPLWYETKTPKTPPTESRRHWDKLDSKRIGLGIVDDLTDQSFRMVLLGSHVRIQNPSLSPSFPSPLESPKSVKTKSQVESFSPEKSSSPGKKSDSGSSDSRVFTGCLSATEMELSEEYTRVISHGPNPRTTHIFDDCIVESFTGPFSASTKKDPHENFLSFCFTCKKNLGQGRDIYIYRGEQAFCSEECRHQEMAMAAEEISKGDLD